MILSVSDDEDEGAHAECTMNDNEDDAHTSKYHPAVEVENMDSVLDVRKGIVVNSTTTQIIEGVSGIA